jgi:5-methylcytosine-specific restriction endonuclease McrA
MCGVNVGDGTKDGRRDWAIDHLIPVAGNYDGHPGDTLPNLAIACHPCNRSKANKLLSEAIARYQFNLTRGT